MELRRSWTFPNEVRRKYIGCFGSLPEFRNFVVRAIFAIEDWSQPRSALSLGGVVSGVTSAASEDWAVAGQARSIAGVERKQRGP